MRKLLEEIKASCERIEEFKSAFLSNAIITLRDGKTGELLYSCQTGEEYGWLAGKNIEVEQEMDIYAVLRDLQALAHDQIKEGRE
jgi:hypothetical protein